jgi:pimeloyl-ACP methyl ester carboxylesterase
MFLDIDGNKLFALEFGAGPRVLLGHSGWTGDFEDWIPLFGPLGSGWPPSPTHRRGAGLSRVEPSRISHRALIDDVFRVMDALRIERCVLGGFSRGTVTALRAVLERPDRFDRLILMNGHGLVELPGEAPRPVVPPSHWPGSTFAEKMHWFAERCTPEPDSEPFRNWVVQAPMRATPEAAERLMTMLPEDRIDWADALPRVALRTLLIHGELDPFCRLEVMQYIASLIPGSRLAVMKQTGHVPSLSQAGVIAEMINEYFGR